jgi:glycerol-3-phosphate dehydrogenase
VTGGEVIIVGGGFQGATMALCASLRGARPLVFDAGAGASLNSLGIVHGGLRYLQTLDLARWGRSRVEQAWWIDTFPEQVKPLACAMPLYRRRWRSAGLFRAAFLAEAALAAGLNMPRGERRGRVLAAAEVEAPAVPRSGLAAYAMWPEAQIDNPEALLASILDRAGGVEKVRRAGVVVEALRVSNGAVSGVRARNSATGADEEYDAPVVILCAGAWSRDLARRFDRDSPRLSASVLGFNLLLDAPAPWPGALAVSPYAGRGRSYFLRPCRSGLLAGTYYAPAPADGAAALVPEALIEAFRLDLDRALPGFGLGDAAVLGVLAGRLPDVEGNGGALRSSDVLWDHGRTGGPRGLYTLLGPKLTTARSLSERLAQRIWGPAAQTRPRPSIVPRTAVADGL